MVRVAVVDERADVLDGRVGWLRAAGHDVTGLSFEDAFAEDSWLTFDVVVLDGRDDREEPVRIGRGALPDRFLGPRVAQHVREACGPERPRIILVSAYARTHPALSLRCQEAGVDFAFDYLDVPSAALFVQAVERPETMTRTPPAKWQSEGFAAEPLIGEALREAELSEATSMLLDPQARGRPGLDYEKRRLRERLGQLLPILTHPTSGHRRRLPHNNEIRPILRRLLGLKIEDDQTQIEDDY